MWDTIPKALWGLSQEGRVPCPLTEARKRPRDRDTRSESESLRRMMAAGLKRRRKCKRNLRNKAKQEQTLTP